ncbi:ankyrin repeat-containing domain protein [Aspergillus taichungensis]|uniref:Ankyrin repeat-containing domain protein n=1 Tax=Aspergillus taichungensis TaxID=482145 RepID=A0A2J5I386_9EURO|nr:ankyrin repeat-containing domain protein [Aspergillus taichungensis]
MEIHLRAAKADLEAHIGDTVRDSDIGCSTQEFQGAMAERIVQRAEGNFLFADSLVKFVLAGDHLEERRRRLTDLPDTVEDAFADMIKRALSHTLHASRRKQILTLVAFAERPLTLQELLHALEIDDHLSNNPLGELPKDEAEERDWMGPADVQARCLGLVIVDESDFTVRFFHRSLHEYLRTQDPEVKQRPIVPSQIVQDRLFRICLGCLELTSVMEQSTRMAKIGDVPDLSGRANDLISYAAAYWGHHLRKAGQWKESLDRAQRYLSREFTERFLSQWHLCNVLPKYYRPKKLTESFLLSFSDLHTVAYFGLHDLVAKLRRRGNVDIDTGDTNNATALHWAAGQGFSAAVETLAAASADVEGQDIDYSPPLVWLMDWVGRLNKADDGKMDTVGVLDRQRQEEAMEAARALLRASNCVNMFFRLGGGRELTHFEHRPELRADSSSPSPPNIWYDIGQYQTLLMRAAAIGWECVTKELLIRDADSTVRNDKGWTALHFAAKGGHESIVKLLLNDGADPNAQDYHGFIPCDVVNQKTAAPVYQLLQDATQGNDRGRQSSERKLRLRGYKMEIDGMEDALNVLDMPSESEGQSHRTIKMRLSRWDPSTRSIVDFEIDPGIRKEFNGTLSDLTSSWKNKEAEGVDPPEPVVWAAYRGYATMIHILLQRGSLIDGRDHDGRTALSWVAQRGDSSTLKVLLQHQADVNARDARGRTPLSWAAEKGHRKAARVLLTHGACMETVDEYQRTPFLWAVMSRRMPLVELMLEHPASPQGTNMTGQTALACAAAAGDVGILKLLLRHARFKTSLESQDQHGCTPLARAVAKGHKEAVQVLLNAGADPNTMDRNKHTPLLWAAKEGHVGMMKLLGANGASLHIPDDQQRSPLAWAAGRGHKKAVKYLLKHQVRHLSSDSSGVTPLAWAAAGGHVKIVKLLLKSGANPSSLDMDGQTPLSWAAQMGEMALGLLALGIAAPVTMRNWFGLRSPPLVSFGGSDELIHAVALPNMSQSNTFKVRSWLSQPSHGRVVKLLLKQRIAIDQPNRNGRTPLSLACETGNQFAVDLLLKYGANPNAPDHVGRSPLSWATGQRISSVFATVLGHSLPETLHAQDRIGRTPVSWAAGAGNVNAVRALSLHGADLNQADDRGRTPLSWAVEMGYFNVVALLIETGANVNCIDQDGRTLLSWSAASGMEDMVKVILQHQESLNIKDATGRAPLSWIGPKGFRPGVSCYFREARRPTEQDIVLDLEWGEEPETGVVKLLVAHGADLKSTDQSNRTPLSWAASQGLTGVVGKMLELGAEVDARDQNGRTPLSWAVETGKLGTVEKLLEHGADAESTDDSNQSILARSLRAGSKEITNRVLSALKSPRVGGLDRSVMA